MIRNMDTTMIKNHFYTLSKTQINNFHKQLMNTFVNIDCAIVTSNK